MKPLAAWCKADYIEKEVTRVQGDQNRIHLEDGTTIDYDLLVLNVGSRSRGSHSVPGIWDHSLATRPINHLLASIEKKEKWLLDNNVTPSVAVCGAGAAGTELAFGYKARWSKLFNKDIPVTLISNTSQILPGVHPSCLEHTLRKLKEKASMSCTTSESRRSWLTGLSSKTESTSSAMFQCGQPVQKPSK